MPARPCAAAASQGAVTLLEHCGHTISKDLGKTSAAASVLATDLPCLQPARHSIALQLLEQQQGVPAERERSAALVGPRSAAAPPGEGCLRRAAARGSCWLASGLWPMQAVQPLGQAWLGVAAAAVVQPAAPSLRRRARPGYPPQREAADTAAWVACSTGSTQG